MAWRFEIIDKNTRYYRPYNAIGRQITVCLTPPSDDSDPVAHFLVSVNDLSEHVLRDVDDSDMVGMTNQNHVNQNDKPIGGIIWSVF